MERFDPEIAVIFRRSGDELETFVILKNEDKVMGQLARREKLRGMVNGIKDMM